MSAVIIKDDKVSLGLLVKKEVWPETVGFLDRLGLTYTSEKQINSEVLGECIKIRDIQGRGDMLAELISWMAVNYQSKVYILLNTNKRRKRKNVRKDRKEAGAGSNS